MEYFLTSFIKISLKTGEINFTNILLNILYKNIIMLTHKEWKNINETFYIYDTRASKWIACFTLTLHPILGEPHIMCSITTYS